MPDPDLLQAFEHTLDALKRTSDVLKMALDAMDRGTRFSDATIADYRVQLQSVDADRLRVEELLRVLWSHVDQQSICRLSSVDLPDRYTRGTQQMPDTDRNPEGRLCLSARRTGSQRHQALAHTNTLTAHVLSPHGVDRRDSVRQLRHGSRLPSLRSALTRPGPVPAAASVWPLSIDASLDRVLASPF
jgi:hypothetical protein